MFKLSELLPSHAIHTFSMFLYEHILFCWLLTQMMFSVALFTRNFYSASPNGIPHSCMCILYHAGNRDWGGVGGVGWGGGGAGIITFVVDCKQTWRSFNAQIITFVVGGWGGGVEGGRDNHVRCWLQTWCSSVCKESRSLLLANKLDVLRCTRNHVRCFLQTNLMFFGVQRITFVDAGKQLDVLRCTKNHVRCCLQTNLMFFGVQRITFVDACKQTWCSSVYKESRSLLLANKLDVLRCTKNHVRCCLQTKFFGVQRITFVDACEQTLCSSVYKESRSLLIANKVDDECVWKGGGGVMTFVVICKQRWLMLMISCECGGFPIVVKQLESSSQSFEMGKKKVLKEWCVFWKRINVITNEFKT